MRVLALAAMTAGCCVSWEAAAQRVADNAVKAADDAFGTTVGNEQTGLYNPYEARGFSPVEAGNVRIEGLYFDQQVQLNSHVGRGNTVRVGISAQSYAFPAPTGVADFSLRLPGDKTGLPAPLEAPLRGGFGRWGERGVSHSSPAGLARRRRGRSRG